MTERQVLLRYAGVALLLYVAAFAALSVGGAKRSTVIVVIAGVLLVIAALLLQITLSRARKRELLSRARPARGRPSGSWPPGSP